MSKKLTYIIFLFIALGLPFFITYWDSSDQAKLKKYSQLNKTQTINVENIIDQNKSNNNVRVNISMLDHFDYLFKLRQELFLHWGFFITVTMALYGCILMRDEKSAELPKHLIAISYTIFTIVILFSFLKILRACNMCVEDIQFLYKPEIKKFPVNGFIRSNIEYNYMRTFWGCALEILFFLIPTYFVIYGSESFLKFKNNISPKRFGLMRKKR